MKKLILGLLVFFSCSNLYAGTITVDSLVSADDVTMAWLNGFKNTVVDALNSFPGDNIETGTIVAGAMDDNTNPEVRWGEAFTEFVYTGLLPPTSASLVSVTTAGTAYIVNDTTHKMTRVNKDATSNTYTASKDTYVDLSSNGTYTYSEVVTGGAEPAVATNSIRLAKVVTNATAVTTVTDMRVLGVQLATNEDFYLKGMEVVTSDPDVITMDSGICYVGGTRIEKIVRTALNVGTASDYISGASERGASKWIYAYLSSSGDIKLSATAPNYHDTDGNTLGYLYYYKSGTTYYRYIGAIRLDAAQKILPFQQDGKYKEWDVPVSITTSISTSAQWSAAVSCATAMPPTAFKGNYILACQTSTASALAGSIRPNGGTDLLPASFVADVSGLEGIGGFVISLTDGSQQIQHCETVGGGTPSNFSIYQIGYYDESL